MYTPQEPASYIVVISIAKFCKTAWSIMMFEFETACCCAVVLTYFAACLSRTHGAFDGQMNGSVTTFDLPYELSIFARLRTTASKS